MSVIWSYSGYLTVSILTFASTAAGSCRCVPGAVGKSSFCRILSFPLSEVWTHATCPCNKAISIWLMITVLFFALGKLNQHYLFKALRPPAPVHSCVLPVLININSSRAPIIGYVQCHVISADCSVRICLAYSWPCCVSRVQFPKSLCTVRVALQIAMLYFWWPQKPVYCPHSLDVITN